MRPFDYVRPTTLAEALAALDEHGTEAVVIAGGTDLMVWLNARQIAPRYVVDIKKLDELKSIRQDGDTIRIGARATFTDLLASDLIRSHARVLAQAAHESAGPQVRNLGTIGGNLGTASPAGDLVAALVALDATIDVASSSGRRTLAIGDFLVGPKRTCLAKNELITAVNISVAGARCGSAFQKLGNRKAMTISIVNAATSVTLSADGQTFERVCLALGAVAPTVVRATAFEEALRGKPATVDEIRAALPRIAEAIAPISDLRASAWYRSQIAPVLAQRKHRRCAGFRQRRTGGRCSDGGQARSWLGQHLLFGDGARRTESLFHQYADARGRQRRRAGRRLRYRPRVDNRDRHHHGRGARASRSTRSPSIRPTPVPAPTTSARSVRVRPSPAAMPPWRPPRRSKPFCSIRRRRSSMSRSNALPSSRA